MMKIPNADFLERTKSEGGSDRRTCPCSGCAHGASFPDTFRRRSALAGGEIGERHLVRAADFRVQVMNLARESVRGKPLGHRVCIQECPINPLRRRAEHSVKSNDVCIVCWHILYVRVFIIPTNGVIDSGH